MKIEQRRIAIVHDQTNVPPQPGGHELLVRGPEVAWSLDKATAESYAERRRSPGCPRLFLVVEDVVEVLVRDDGIISRLHPWSPLDPKAEREAAKAALFARLTPEERALLREP